MTQPLEAVGGSNDTIVAAEPTIEDRFAAFGNEQVEDKKPEEEAQPLGEGEIDPALLTADAEAEVAAEPPIAPPVSWTAEEKAEFAELPRSLQETLTRRETEREKFVQSKAQEAKATEQRVAQAAQERLTAAQDRHVETLRALLPEIPARPAASLMARDPNQYAYQMEAHESAIAQHQYVQQVAQQIEAQQSAAAKEAEQQDRVEGARILQEKFPEYFDEAKRAEFERAFKSTALALEYPEDQLGTFDATDIIRLKTVSGWKAKADKLDTLMAKQMQTVRDAKKLPTVSRPGTPLARGAAEGERYQADRQAMNRGDRDAAARVFSRFV